MNSTVPLRSVQPVLMSRDVGRSVAFFERLGFTLSFVDSSTNPTYAGVVREEVELHLQLHDASEWEHPNDRPTYRFPVAAVDELYREFESAGVAGMRPPWATDWGTYEFHVRDPDQNGLQFYRDR